MIYVLFHYLGLPEPAPWLAMTIAIGTIFAVLFGGLALMFRADARNHARHKNSNLLRRSFHYYNQWKRTEDAVMEVLRPALLKYQETLFRRDGKTYDDIRWLLDRDQITLIASQKETPAPYQIAQTRRMVVPTKYFDPAYDILYVIEGMVWEHEDESDEDRERLEALNAERMCEHCDGEGEARVRGIRTETGYDMCVHCGGTGEKP
ncbi:hypothetical protein RCXUPER_197 [Rhodobacter phage RcXuper]|nr:hypothetical protein RCXUPER_197 [Rhodobacter phage RcXuper]